MKETIKLQGVTNFGTDTIKHCGLVIYGFCNNLVCLTKKVKVTNNKKNTSLLQRLYIPIHYELAMFNSTGPSVRIRNASFSS
jgi:hypothetical protein